MCVHEATNDKNICCDALSDDGDEGGDTCYTWLPDVISTTENLARFSSVAIVLEPVTPAVALKMLKDVRVRRVSSRGS